MSTMIQITEGEYVGCVGSKTADHISIRVNDRWVELDADEYPHEIYVIGTTKDRNKNVW